MILHILSTFLTELHRNGHHLQANKVAAGCCLLHLQEACLHVRSGLERVTEVGGGGIEAGAFVKMFPRTPLIGIYGNGELGVSHVPDFKQKQDNQQEQKSGQSRGRGAEYLPPGQFLHSFTTIFVMVSLGKV